MSNNNETLTEGNYLRIVVGLNKPFDETHLLTIKFPNGAKPEEKVKKVYIVYLLCRSEKDAQRLKSDIDSNSIVKEVINEKTKEVESYSITIDGECGAVKFIDPDTRLNLGNSVIFTTLAAGKYKFQVATSFIRPPEWIPIENGKVLRIDAKKCPLEVLVVDRKIGEIVYRTDAIEIRGTDLRVYGDEIRYEKGNTLVVKNWADGGGGKVSSLYQLEVQGTGLEIKDIRTSDVERIRIRRGEKIKAQVESNQFDEGKKKGGKHDIGGSGKWGLLLLFEIIVLLALTLFPFWPFVTTNSHYLDVLQGKCATNETAVAVCSIPAKVTNTLSLQAACQGQPRQNSITNSVGASATSVSSTSDLPSSAANSERAGLGRVTFYFVLACLLYVTFYGVVVYFTILTVHTLKRSSKLNGNMRSVIEALRNERDKDKRKAMQRKILDDMINTYLDKPSAED